ncbi:protein unc-50 homolog [Odontomachus brunneus]|uniref:protein unc-50 homolog n=1 Tax=Odontomachus brunneus TaxID=486640 RepID=UPI0013F1C83C|nr:protein unc-50 homolog [Odontomachus brunneus]XP_032676063.1 protein unc-50 homolog [Odontomachus brunneus]XP_032676064.1 protein unc-50 homolog [Odontomachus brunneus]XP_032676065.1 protein unc-50 homolog [Odontomachus brunneus]XP_032676067.1 protein unc-50 homolog [Odontomachus brunneus]XP_032676068.1 protein unc-50 homolog [Odontomachus brunneus]XP_032676069.1 protein unc-50 homolog [Odontomachus brunneus]
MKYSTSPPTSRCHSPIPTEFSSSLPMPVVYRHNCMGAATKCYKYLRKLLKFEQMDFEFALWQIIFLFVAPQKVYRNFKNRKQTKSQFARDDPAFFVLLTCSYSISTVGFAIVLGLGFFQYVKLLFYMMFIEYMCVGFLTATIFWFITNRYLRIDKIQDVEWGYAFDIHMNAVFPPLIILHILQLFVYNALINGDTFSARFIGNTLWFIAIIYYIYITFLGYASIEILHKTHLILSTLPLILLTYITTLCAGINVSYLVMEFYFYRAI